MMTMKHWLLCIVMALMHEICRTANIYSADIETMLTRNGLPFVGRALVDRVINQSSAAQYDYEGSFSFDSGKTGLKAQLSNLRVHEVNIPKPVLDIGPNEDLKFSVNKMSFEIEFGCTDATFRGSPILSSNSEKFSILANDIEVEVNVKMSNVLSPVTCTAAINDLGLVSGDMIWFTLFSRSITLELETMVCEEAKKLFDVTQIRSMMTMIDLNNDTVRATVMKSHFKLEQDSIRTYHNFTGDIDAPIKTMVMPDDKMFGLALNERAASKVLKMSNWLKGKRSHVMGESYWRQLSRAFNLGWTKANEPLEMSIDIHAPPTCSITPDGITINLFGNITVDSSDASSERALKPMTVNFNCTLAFRLFVSRDHKKLRMEFQGIQFFDTTGKVDYAKLNKIVKFVLEKYVTTAKVITIPLPMIDDVTFVNPILTLHQGYIILSTDVELVPRE